MTSRPRDCDSGLSSRSCAIYSARSAVTSVPRQPLSDSLRSSSVSPVSPVILSRFLRPLRPSRHPPLPQLPRSTDRRQVDGVGQTSFLDVERGDLAAKRYGLQ